MIILKLNFMATYSKLLQGYFDSIDTINVDKEKHGHHIYDYIYKKSFLKSLYVNGCYDTCSINYIGIIEDIREFMPNSIDTFIDSFDVSPIVLFPFVPAKDRIKSLVFRHIMLKDPTKIRTIDDVIHDYFKLHYTTMTNDFLLELNHINFDNVIMMRNFEHLVQLHNENRIRLVVLTKDTILNDPQKIFDTLNIECIFEKEKVNRFYTNRKDKIVTEQNKNIFLDTMYTHENAFIQRYNEINTLIAHNDITII